MYDDALLSDATDPARALHDIRATGGVDLAFAYSAGTTRISDLAERGGFRAKFPRPEHGTEAVLINTGGGMLGGDRIRHTVSLAPGAVATVTSQSAERIYRSLGPPTTIEQRLEVAAGARLSWLPQETILFSGARLHRSIVGEVAADGHLLLAESLVFGRAAMKEVVTQGALIDRWRISRAGELVYAEQTRLADDMNALLKRAAIGNGARAAATVLYVGPDAEDCRDRARAALTRPNGRLACSAWNGMLAVRLLAADSAALRNDLSSLIPLLTRAPLPRVWGQPWQPEPTLDHMSDRHL